MNFDLNYIASGEGKTVIFQHGLGAHLNQAQGTLSGLDRVRLISMDCRGHGQSPLPVDYTPSFNAYTDDVLRLMDHLNIEKAVFGGISMGSGISLQMALRYPERVKGLILVRPAWLDKGRPENLEILLELIPFLLQPDGKAKFEQTGSFQKIKVAVPNAATSVLGQFSRDQGDATPRILEFMVKDAPFSDIQQLQTIEHPTLIIGNENDPLHPFEMAAEIGKFISRSEVHKVISRYVDDAEHKSKVRQLVTSFLTHIDT